MPDPVTALQGARYEGLATITDAGPTGMITLRGDLASDAVRDAVQHATASACPPASGADGRGHRRALDGAGRAAADLPLCGGHGQARDPRAALAGQHFLAVNVSDARSHLHVAGPGAREVLAKLCPVDLSPDAFTPGMVRRTRMAQIAAAFWLDDAARST